MTIKSVYDSLREFGLDQTKHSPLECLTVIKGLTDEQRETALEVIQSYREGRTTKVNSRKLQDLKTALIQKKTPVSGNRAKKGLQNLMGKVGKSLGRISSESLLVAISLDRPKTNDIHKMMQELMTSHQTIDFKLELEKRGFSPNVTSFDFGAVGKVHQGTSLRRLSNIKFEGIHFVDCDFNQLELNDIKFKNCEFTVLRNGIGRCNFEGTTFKDVVFDNCKLLETQFKDNTFDQCTLNKLEFRDCTIKRPILKNTEVKECYAWLKDEASYNMPIYDMLAEL